MTDVVPSVEEHWNSTARIREDSFAGSTTKSAKSKGKSGTGKESQADKKKKAKEDAAHREALLSGRNAGYVLNYLEKKTHFDRDQIRALQKIYRSFKGSYQMDRLRFREMVASLLGVTDNMMLDRIFQAFDGDNEGSVSESEWIIGLSVMLRGSLDQQIAYTYDVYDINGDRSIGRDEILSYLRNSVYTINGVLEAEEVDESVNELVEIAMKKFDINKDGNIRLSEFRHIIHQDPLLLEAFGDCLPRERAVVPFMSLLDTNQRSYSCYLSRPGDIGWSQERTRYIKFKEDQYHAGYERDHSIDELKSDSPTSWSNMGLVLMKDSANTNNKKKQISKPKPLQPKPAKKKVTKFS